MITMIVDTLPVFYYEKMVEYMTLSFSDLVFVGERIEVGLRRGKFDYVASMSAGNRRPGVGGAKKKEGDALLAYYIPIPPSSRGYLIPYYVYVFFILFNRASIFCAEIKKEKTK